MSVRYPVQKKFLIALVKIAATAITGIIGMNQLINVTVDNYMGSHKSFDNKRKSEKVKVLGDSMPNNIDGCGLSKSKKVAIKKHPGATSENMITDIEKSLNEKPDYLIVHAGSSD